MYEKIRFVKGVNLVTGRPGGGKTRRTLYTLAKSRKFIPALIVSPLRYLRDWMAYVLQEFGADKVKILRSREEICPAFRKALSELLPLVKQRYGDVIKYFYPAIAENICKNCKYYKKCGYYKQFKDLEDYNFICITYKMLPSMMSFSFESVYYDELETFIDAINLAIDDKTFEKIRKDLPEAKKYFEKVEFLNQYLWLFSRKINKFFPKYVYVPKTSAFMRKYTIISTATLVRGFTLLFKKEDFDRVRRIHLRVPLGDDSIYGFNVGSSFQRDQYLEFLIDYFMKKTREKIGFVSPHKALSKRIYKKYQDEASCDLVDPKPNRDKRLIIVTTKGKWFRGVNVDDRKLIIAGFQYQTQCGYPILNPYLQKLIEGGDLGVTISREMLWATNIQALFRFIRIPSGKHVIVTPNYYSFVNAIDYFMNNYYKHLYKRSYKQDKVDLMLSEVLANV